MSIQSRKTVFSTPWFSVTAKSQESESETAPYYVLEMQDYVSVIAVTTAEEIVLVRQYRPAVDMWTLELPSGHVGEGESPEDSARRELLEETGYEAKVLEVLGSLYPDTGRLSNRLWCYFAPNVRRVSAAEHPESGIEVLRVSPKIFFEQVEDLRLNHALNIGAILLAILKRKIVIPKN